MASTPSEQPKDSNSSSQSHRRHHGRRKDTKALAHARKEAHMAQRGMWPWILFSVAALFYFYEFFARVAPGVLKQDLIDVTGASEGAFGLAMGMYFLAYAPAQLLVGRMLDQFGTRIVVAPAAILVALGCLIFASTDNIWMMGGGRFLQGLGSAVAYLGTVYLAMVWFPPHRHGIIPGITVVAGTIGASTAQFPLAVLAENFGWRTPMFMCVFFGLAIAVALWFLVPRRPSWFIELMKEDGFDPENSESIFTSVIKTARDSQLWLVSLAAAGLYLPISVIGDLWGVTFMEIEAGIPIKWGSLITTLIFVGFALGGVVFGRLADKTGRRKLFFLGTSLVGVCLAGLIMLIGINPTWVTVLLMFLLGFTTGGQTLAFVMTADRAARHTRGMKLAFVNFVVMILPVVVQPGVGFLATMGVTSGSTPTPGQELRGYGLVVALMVVATVILFFVRDTRSREDGHVAFH
ncbi:MAG: MFS transporter [Phycisphaerales bacterium]|nr:MFS transporter [Phycisphaerales bacterium]